MCLEVCLPVPEPCFTEIAMYNQDRCSVCFYRYTYWHMLPLGPTCLVLEPTCDWQQQPVSFKDNTSDICSDLGSGVCNLCKMHIIALLP